MNETKYWLWLSMVFGTGSRRIWEAMCLFENAEEAYTELSSGEHNFRLSDSEISNIRSVTIETAVSLMKACSDKGIMLCGYGDSEYPPQLRHIMNPPAVLYYKGNIGCLSGTRTVTAVGARKASAYSLGTTTRICGELAASGIVIVSGFAVGTDITAQLAAADKGRPTACVLGCGVDVDYPRDNVKYRDSILANGGVFISEYPPATPPLAANFPKRNRILAALGRVTLVFEASAKSGSLITANLAAEQGRDVFCLPPCDIFGEMCSGNVMLLRDGAYLLLDSRDVLDCFKIGSAVDAEIRSSADTGVSSFGVGELSPLPHRTGEKKKASQKIKDISDELQPPETPPAKKAEPLPDGLSDIQRKIAELLSDGKKHADELAVMLEMDSSALMTELTELELEGTVRALPGKMYELN